MTLHTPTLVGLWLIFVVAKQKKNQQCKCPVLGLNSNTYSSLISAAILKQIKINRKEWRLTLETENVPPFFSIASYESVPGRHEALLFQQHNKYQRRDEKGKGRQRIKTCQWRP